MMKHVVYKNFDGEVLTVEIDGVEQQLEFKETINFRQRRLDIGDGFFDVLFENQNHVVMHPEVYYAPSEGVMIADVFADKPQYCADPPLYCVEQRKVKVTVTKWEVV